MQRPRPRLAGQHRRPPCMASSASISTTSCRGSAVEWKRSSCRAHLAILFAGYKIRNAATRSSPRQNQLMFCRFASSTRDRWGWSAVITVAHLRVHAVVNPTPERRRDRGHRCLCGGRSPAAEREIRVWCDALGDTRVGVITQRDGDVVPRDVEIEIIETAGECRSHRSDLEKCVGVVGITSPIVIRWPNGRRVTARP